MPRPGARTRPLLRAPSRDLDSVASLRLTRLSAGLVLIRVSPTDDDDQHHDPFAGTTLTRAERIVVHLVLGGLSNVEVAKVRGAARKTRMAGLRPAAQVLKATPGGGAG